MIRHLRIIDILTDSRFYDSSRFTLKDRLGTKFLFWTKSTIRLGVGYRNSTNKKGEADDLAATFIRTKLIAGRSRCRQHVDPLALFVEKHLAVDQRE